MNVHAMVQVFFVISLWLMIMFIVVAVQIIRAKQEAKRIELNCAKIKRSVPRKSMKQKRTTYSWF